MSLIAILGDTHFGLRNSLPVFYPHYTKFYNYFIDYLITNNITTLIQLGDLFDSRKSINTQSLKIAKEIFFNPLLENNIQLYTLIGNHDAHFKESILVNTPELVLGEYSNVTIFSSPKTISLYDITFDMIPWICKENEVEILEFIQTSKSRFCCGHFEMSDFLMYKDIPVHAGIDKKTFEHYELVLSGHYHTYSQQDNIVYTGVPYEMTWQDYNDQKGFYIYDTELNKLDFIKNPYNTFYKFDYDEDVELPNIEVDLENTFVKVNILKKTNNNLFEEFINSITEKKCYDLKIHEPNVSVHTTADIEEFDIEDTISIIHTYIDNSNITVDKNIVKDFIKELYIEAVSLGDSK